MSSMPFCRSDRLLAVTWTADAGTPLDGYDVDQLTDLDPSSPMAIEETTIGLQGDLGSALRIDGVAVIHHNFREGTTVRLRVNSAASWGSPVDITVTVVVPAWLGRFAPHLYFNVAAAETVIADRTRRYIYLDNMDANDVPVKIGELVCAGQVDTLTRGIQVQPSTTLTYGRSVVAAKKGPEYIHDRRTRDRGWIGTVALETVDRDTFQAWQDQSYAVLPFLAWPLNSISDEPIFARFSDSSYAPTLTLPNLNHSAFSIRELSCGEAY